jgi:hypothetical protein
MHVARDACHVETVRYVKRGRCNVSRGSPAGSHAGRAGARLARAACGRGKALREPRGLVRCTPYRSRNKNVVRRGSEAGDDAEAAQ